MASDLSRNNSAEDPTLRHRAAHNDAKKNDRAEDPDQELEYERKKRKSQMKRYQHKTRCKLYFFIEIKTKFTSDSRRSSSSLPHLIIRMKTRNHSCHTSTLEI
jgi:hypothetical protein